MGWHATAQSVAMLLPCNSHSTLYYFCALTKGIQDYHVVLHHQLKEKWLVTSLVFFWLCIFLIHSFSFYYFFFHMGELFLQRKPQKVKKNIFEWKSHHTPRKLELQTKTSVNICLCRCIVTLLGLTVFHRMCSWVKGQIIFVFLDSKTTGPVLGIKNFWY